MRLYYSPTSPYARKIRMVLAEKGLQNLVEAVPCSPFEDAAELISVNPLGKVPCLVLDDGSTVFDSPAIADYLDSLDSSVRLIPSDGADRLRVLRQQALGDGILDAAYAVVTERRRPGENQSSDWLLRWTAAITRAMKFLEQELDGPGETLTLGEITIGAALGYLDFRLADLAWRDDNPITAAWYTRFAERPSMIATRPDA